MFPTAGSQVYYNSDGEPIGWDASPYDDAPEVPFYDDPAYDESDIDMDEDDWPDQAACKHDSRTQVDVRHETPALEEMPTRDAIRWECDNPNCAHQAFLTDEEFEEYINN